MRVLYFSRDYTTHDRRFLLKMGSSGHEIRFLRLEDDGIPYERRALPEGVSGVAWPGGRTAARTPEEWFRLLPALDRVISEVKPDLIHAGPIQSCAFLVAALGFRPLLSMSWGSDVLIDADRDEQWAFLTRYALARSDYFLCDCDAVRVKATGFAPIAPERIVQFPWGIDLERFGPGPDRLGLRGRAGWEDAVIVLSTRAWDRIYGIDTLLIAFERAYRRDHRLRLVLLGGGPLAAEVLRLIDQLGIAAVVDRPGVVGHEQLTDYFRAADIYLSCTLSDGTSISLLEAMATGLPVVVTDAPGNREWVAPGINGWLAPGGDADGFSDQLLAAAALSSDERRRISKANRAVASERADWSRNAAKLLALYDRIAAAR